MAKKRTRRGGNTSVDEPANENRDSNRSGGESGSRHLASLASYRSSPFLSSKYFPFLTC